MQLGVVEESHGCFDFGFGVLDFGFVRGNETDVFYSGWFGWGSHRVPSHFMFSLHHLEGSV